MRWRKKLQTPEANSETSEQSVFIELTAPAQVLPAAPRQQHLQNESTLCLELSLGKGKELRITSRN